MFEIFDLTIPDPCKNGKTHPDKPYDTGDDAIHHDDRNTLTGEVETESTIDDAHGDENAAYPYMGKGERVWFTCRSGNGGLGVVAFPNEVVAEAEERLKEEHTDGDEANDGMGLHELAVCDSDPDSSLHGCKGNNIA